MMERQDAVASILLVMFLVATTAGQNGLMMSLKLRVSRYSPPQTPETCIGGDDVGLTETSVLAQYRVKREPAALTEWQLLKEIDLSQGFDNTLSFNTTTSEMSTSPHSLQFRLLQVQHGGGGCNCWQLGATEVTATFNDTTVMMGSMFFTDRCLSVPSGNASIFCGGSASNARGFISRALRFDGQPDMECPEDSNTTLISSKGPSLPSDCPANTLPM